jgi:hypothetical protein
MSSLKLWHEPNNIEDALMLADTVVSAKLAPKGLETKQKVFTVMASGAELGLSPMASLQNMHVVHGKVGLSSDAMVGLVLQRGSCTQWDYEIISDEIVTLTARRGSGKPLTLSWDVARAEKAGLIGKGGTWSSYRRTMLKHRVDSEMARALWSDVVGGFYTPDEIRSIDAAAPAVDLPELPVTGAAPAIEAEPIVEAVDSLGDVPSLGKGTVSKCERQGIMTQRDLYEAIVAGKKPSGMRTESVEWLIEKFGEPAQEPEEDPHIADLAERIEAGREQGMAPVDFIMAQLVEDGIAPDADAALDLFTGTLKALDLSYDECSCEQLAVVWDKASS